MENMIEIIKIYKQKLNSSKFVGKKYDNADRVNGSFEVKLKWKEWYEKGWFKTIERQINENIDDTCEEKSSYIGLLRNKHGEPFQYWIGMFTPENTKVPEGYDFINFKKCELCICWVYGDKDYVSMNNSIDIFNQCNEKLKKEGIHHIHDKNDICWAFERYSIPRSSTPDEKGNIILDIGFFVNFY
jgi:hypothetical protein